MPSLSDLRPLVGFFSYARDDDELMNARLSELRLKIHKELRIQLGSDIQLWQDKEAIAEGAQWEAEIKRAISQSVFFIPILTPISVKSEYCVLEFESFLAREAALDRNDLIFPLLYVEVLELANEQLWRQHKVLSIVGPRQYLDWRKYRHRSANEQRPAAEIEKFCRNIVKALTRSWVPREQRLAAEAEERRLAQELQQADEARRAEAQRLAELQEEQERQAAAEAETRLKAEEAESKEKRSAALAAEARRRAKQPSSQHAGEAREQRRQEGATESR